MSRVRWQWRLLDAEDRVLDRPLSPAFTTRFDAEAWVGETWRDLAGQGVAAAQLLLDDSPIGAVLPLRTV